MRKYALDTNVYIDADRNAEEAEQLAGFYSAFLPFTYLHATVAQELLAGAIDSRRRQLVYRSYIQPFERRGRVVTPEYSAWRRSGDVLAALVQRKLISPGGMARSFINDVLLAVSCRENGLVLLTRNLDDFALIQRVEPFEFSPPYLTE